MDLEGESTKDYTEKYQTVKNFKMKCKYITLCKEVGNWAREAQII